MTVDVVRQWAADARRFVAEWPNHGATVAAGEITRYVASDTGGDGRLRNHPSGPATVEIEAGDGEAAAVAAGSLAVWAILEYGTKPHRIAARPGGFLNTPFGPRRMVQVSGMAARQTWSNGAVAGSAEAVRDAEAAFTSEFG
jgi:hypothetical protein